MKPVVTLVAGSIAWLWSIFTIFQVGRFGGAVVIDASTTGRIYSVRNGPEVTSAIGLSWHGILGAGIVLLELALVVTALVFSLSTRTWKRRFAAIVLSAWSLLWLGNALWMESLSAGRHPANATLIAVCSG